MKTLKQLDKAIKKLTLAAGREVALVKVGRGSTQRFVKYMDAAAQIRAEVTRRQDPKNAIRCSLPKRVQRKMGLLPAVAN
jgi:hypothetical protein